MLIEMHVCFWLKPASNEFILLNQKMKRADASVGCYMLCLTNLLAHVVRCRPYTSWNIQLKLMQIKSQLLKFKV